MEEFDDRLPARKFDNFQFVSFDSVKTKAKQSQQSQAAQVWFSIIRSSVLWAPLIWSSVVRSFLRTSRALLRRIRAVFLALGSQTVREQNARDASLQTLLGSPRQSPFAGY